LIEDFLEQARVVFEGRASLGKSTGTADQHYKRFAKLGVKGYVLDDKPPEEDLLEEMAHLMVWYTDIRNRQSFGYRFEPISIEAVRGYEVWLGKMGLELSAFDEEMLWRLDAVWMDSQPDPQGNTAKRATRH
jgi:hypothetical protein